MQPENPNASRRAMVGGLATGLLGAAIVPASAATAADQVSNGTPASAPNVPLLDPRTAYKQPPFETQQQPWPGLSGKMNPRPDHGETTYKGSGRLKGRKALITGGDSGIGRAAAIA